MKRFIVVNRMEPDKAVAYLSYDPKNRNFQLSLNKNAQKEAFQGMLRVFYDKKCMNPVKSGVRDGCGNGSRPANVREWEPFFAKIG